MSKDFKIGVLGAGAWGKNLVRSFNKLGVLHSVSDPSEEIRNRLSKEYPDVSFVSDTDEILNNPEITAISIATPAETHAGLIEKALMAGKDVLVEKPLCLSEEDAARVIALAKEKKLILMVGHLLWYHPIVLKLNEMIKAGELGDIRSIYSNRLNLGKLRREENVLWSFAPHDVSVILGLLNETPSSVQAHGGNFIQPDIADVTVSLLNFPSGKRAHIFVSWLHPYKEQRMVVVGSRKMAVFDDTAPWEKKLCVYPHEVRWEGKIPVAAKAECYTVEVKQDEPLLAECQHFLDRLADRKTPRTDGAEGARVLHILNACEQSLRTQKTIEID
ncbi:Gfo/Idh/MocA family oxidoreductase [Myxococcota bacterium]|nr:Gfo/Idh/MocA family oxidoreductase [Myxococcota bacterium]